MIKRYKNELKDTYVKVDEASRERATELRRLLEDAVKDLEDYQTLLDGARIPIERLEKKKRTAAPEGKKVKYTKDSSASRAAYRAAKEEQAEIDDIVDEMRDAHDAADAKAEMEKVKSGEVSLEAVEKTTETNNKEENNNEKDRKVEDL